jgi:nucleotide-binding universal stress UspA family protein
VHVAERHHIYFRRTAGPLPSPQTDEEVKKEHQALLGHEVLQIKQAGENVAETHLRVSEEIIAGLIVVGNQVLGRKFSRLKRFLMESASLRGSQLMRAAR